MATIEQEGQDKTSGPQNQKVNPSLETNFARVGLLLNFTHNDIPAVPGYLPQGHRGQDQSNEGHGWLIWGFNNIQNDKSTRKDTGHYWQLSKTSLLTCCISRYA